MRIGKYRLRFDRLRSGPPPDPGVRTSWIVYRLRYRFFPVKLGYVNAKGEAQALDRAKAKWPDIDTFLVHPKWRDD